MKHLIILEEWVKQKIGTEIVELPNAPILVQIDAYDKSGCGIGLILVYAILETEDKSDQIYDVISIPIVKIRNQWMTVTDDLSDIVRDIIVMLVPNEDTNVGK